MDQIRTVSKLQLSFLEEWNEANPTERLTKEFIDVITRYLYHAYVAGCEDLGQYVLRAIERNETKSRNIASKYVEESIFKYRPVR